MSSRRAELRRSESSRFTPRNENPSFQARMQEGTRNLESHPTRAQIRRSRSNAAYQGSTLNAGLRPRDGEGLVPSYLDDRPRPARTALYNHLFDDEPPSTIRPHSLMPALQHDSDEDVERPRAKRIKLDADDRSEGIRGFRYGHYGQVVPGALGMEIISCDGGSYEPQGESSCPGNILLNDDSVYCTKRDRCNIILRHQGATPFCLKKLVIRAPKSGFDSP
jgi:hypothetical protein